MEDVLDVYQQPRDPDFPLVCLDEVSKQLLEDTREAMPMKPGRPARPDYEYKRQGYPTFLWCLRHSKVGGTSK